MNLLAFEKLDRSSSPDLWENVDFSNFTKNVSTLKNSIKKLIILSKLFLSNNKLKDSKQTNSSNPKTSQNSDSSTRKWMSDFNREDIELINGKKTT